MSIRVDANIFVGQYPFRSMARSTVDECTAKLESLGFDRAVLSPIEAIFQEDSFAAEKRLAAEIEGDARFIHFKIVNPMRPWWQEDLKRGVGELAIRGIRLCANYHGYALNGPEAAGVLDFAADHDLPVLVMCRMQDYRMQWMFKTTEATSEEIAYILSTRTANKLILAGIHFPEMLQLAEEVNKLENVLLETSRLKGPWRAFRKLAERMDLSRVAFGSLWPINLPDCPLEQIKAAHLDEAMESKILGDNLCRLLGVAK